MRLTEIEWKEFSKYFSFYDFSKYIKGKTFLVTGSKGIVGSGIIKWLLLANQLYQANVRIFASTRTPDIIPNYVEKSDLISYCMFGEEDHLEKIDYIIHAASPTGRDIFVSRPVESLHVIFDETDNMLRIATKNKCPMIYLSSEEVYGISNLEEPIDEIYVGAIDNLNVRSCYPLGKKVAELLCISYFSEYGTDVKIIRPTVIHGLLQEYSAVKVESEILRCIIENKNMLMKSRGMTKKSMIYSLDAVSAVLTVLFTGKSGEIYNATNPDTFMAVKDLAVYLFQKFNPEISVEFTVGDISQSEGYLPQRSVLERIDKIKNLGWRPKTGIDEIYQVDIERFRGK